MTENTGETTLVTERFTFSCGCYVDIRDGEFWGQGAGSRCHVIDRSEDPDEEDED